MMNNICSVCNEQEPGLLNVAGISICQNIKTCKNTYKWRTVHPWNSSLERIDVLKNIVASIKLNTDSYIAILHCNENELKTFINVEEAKIWCNNYLVALGYILEE